MSAITRVTGLILLLTGGVAAANAPMPLFVKARNTHLKASSAPNARTVAILQPGDEVTFLGREPGTPWCRVEVQPAKASKATKGVIFQANLSASAPRPEIQTSGSGEALDPQAFASSGAAVKALGPGAIDYGEQQPELASHVKSLHALEELAAKVDEAAIARSAKSKNLPTVVGPTARGAK
ncbi:MAG TPA: SH3 domain-containing protein [Myxococcaceae bacterium]|nr:SH3 domain-containing protein [Myxococcaceae bacterium]